MKIIVLTIINLKAIKKVSKTKFLFTKILIKISIALKTCFSYHHDG